MTTREKRLWVVIFGLICLCALLLAMSVKADEFRAVVVTDSESAALRSAKAKADEAQAAFVKLREATEAKYRERLGGVMSFDWSSDFRVIAEPRRTYSNSPAWLTPHQYCGPNCTFTLNLPATEPFTSHADLRNDLWPTLNLGAPAPGHDTGVLWSLDIPGTLSTGPVKSPLVFK